MGPHRNIIHDDRLNKHIKGQTTHDPGFLVGFLSQFQLTLKVSGNTVKLTEPTPFFGP
jgi:hypothetical protein